MPGHILLFVGHDEPTRENVATRLAEGGFRVTTARTAAAVRHILRRERTDLALVDLSLPGDGLSLTRFVREHFNIGIVIIIGKNDPVDRAIGLEVGADDCVAKPVYMRELLATVKSVLRRIRSRLPVQALVGPTELWFGGWCLDLARRELRSPQGRVLLTAAEFELLLALAGEPNKVLTRDQLLDRIAERKWDPSDRAVDQHISHLRRKIEKDPKRPELIKSVRGRGYVFSAAVERKFR